MKKRRTSFQVLKDNRIPLTKDERNLVIKSNATWHFTGKPTPAVWKSKNSRGEITFVTNTHRAYNTAKTVKGAINRYHKFIKSTA